MNPITAKEARQIAEGVVDLESKTLQYFFECVKEALNENPRKKGMEFKTRHTAYPDLTDNEVKYLREELGYYISWNGACLWYEVSWEEQL